MKEKKYVIASFTFYDRTGIQAYLERQAAEGWLLERISSFFWTFRRMEPKNIHYAVTYFPKASVYDPEPTEHQRIFQEYCAHLGWLPAGSSGPLHIFYNEQEDPVPVETDPVSELESIRKTAKKTYLPSYFLLFIVGCMQLSTQVSSLIRSPLDALSSNLTLFNWLAIMVLLTLSLTEIVGYYRWYHKAKKAALEQGYFVPTRGFRVLQLFLLGFETSMLILLLFNLEKRISLAMILSLAGIFGIMLLVFWLQKKMREAGVERGINIAATILVTLVLSFAYSAGLVYCIIQVWDLQIWKEEAPETYTAGGIQWEIYQDELPLQVEDLMEPGYQRYSCRWEESGSLLVSKFWGNQEHRVGESAPELEYTIYEIHFPPLYQICLEDLLTEYDGFYADEILAVAYQSTDAAPWGVDNAYQRYHGSEPTNHYILCWGNRMVKISFDWAPTEAQMELVREKLLP